MSRKSNNGASHGLGLEEIKPWNIMNLLILSSELKCFYSKCKNVFNEPLLKLSGRYDEGTLTIDVNGKYLFHLHDTHGIPVEAAMSMIRITLKDSPEDGVTKYNELSREYYAQQELGIVEKVTAFK